MKAKDPVRASMAPAAFTLLEVLLSIGILSILVLMLTSVLSSVQSTVTRSRSQVEEFEGARVAFESMARRISQATVNAYWGYIFDNPNAANPNPVEFNRNSDLHYLSGQQSLLLPDSLGNGHAVFFQALLGDSDPDTPLGQDMTKMKNLLNCWGYFVDYVSDLDARPEFLKTSSAQVLNPERKRFRLMEFRQPPDQSILFSMDINSKKSYDDICQWFRGPFKDGSKSTRDYSVPVADNVLAMVIVPYIFVTNSSTSGGTAGGSFTDTRKKKYLEYDTREYQRPANYGGTSQSSLSSRHKPPAMLEVTVIATDEASYQRLEDKLGVDEAYEAVREALPGTSFAESSKFIDEWAKAEKALTDLGLHVKLFTTTISISSSKWISERIEDV